MKQPIKITIVTNTHWEALYINDKLVFNDSEITARDLLKALKLKCKFVETEDWKPPINFKSLNFYERIDEV